MSCDIKSCSSQRDVNLSVVKNMRRSSEFREKGSPGPRIPRQRCEIQLRLQNARHAVLSHFLFTMSSLPHNAGHDEEHFEISMISLPEVCDRNAGNHERRDVLPAELHVVDFLLQ